MRSPHFEIVFQYLMHMHNCLVMKWQIDPIENELAHVENEVWEWYKFDWLARWIFRMHFFESVYFTIHPCVTTYKLWQTLSDTREKNGARRFVDLGAYIKRRIWCYQGWFRCSLSKARGFKKEWKMLNVFFMFNGCIHWRYQTPLWYFLHWHEACAMYKQLIPSNFVLE